MTLPLPQACAEIQQRCDDVANAAYCHGFDPLSREAAQAVDTTKAAFTNALAALEARVAEAVAAEREACAKVAEEAASNAQRIWKRWTPGTDGNERVIAIWQAREQGALEVAAAIRTRAAAQSGEGKE